MFTLYFYTNRIRNKWIKNSAQIHQIYVALLAKKSILTYILWNLNIGEHW